MFGHQIFRRSGIFSKKNVLLSHGFYFYIYISGPSEFQKRLNICKNLLNLYTFWFRHLLEQCKQYSGFVVIYWPIVSYKFKWDTSTLIRWILDGLLHYVCYMPALNRVVHWYRHHLEKEIWSINVVSICNSSK